MRNYIFVVACLQIATVVGCAQNDNTQKQPLQIVNNSQRTDASEFAQSIIDATESLVDMPIDLRGYVITLEANIGDGCPSSGEGKTTEGCTDLVAHTIHVPFLVVGAPGTVNLYSGPGGTTISVPMTDKEIQKAIAVVLCHELGHVHFMETERNPDENHLHTEWGYTGAPGTVCATVADDVTQ